MYEGQIALDMITSAASTFDGVQENPRVTSISYCCDRKGVELIPTRTFCQGPTRFAGLILSLLLSDPIASIRPYLCTAELRS